MVIRHFYDQNLPLTLAASMRKLIMIFGTMAIFLAIDMYVAHIMEPEAHSPREAVQKAGVDLLAQVLARAMKWRMKLPQQVDGTTRLEDIHAEKNMVIYSMSTSIDGDAFDRLMSEIHDHMDKASCTREDYRKMLAFGLSIAISFRSPSGKESVPVMITPQMCGAP